MQSLVIHVVEVRGWDVVESPTSLTNAGKDGERAFLRMLLGAMTTQLGIRIELGLDLELELEQELRYSCCCLEQNIRWGLAGMTTY